MRIPSDTIKSIKANLIEGSKQIGKLGDRAITVLSSSLTALSVLGTTDGVYKGSKAVISTSNFAKQAFNVSFLANYAKALSPVASLHTLIRPFERLNTALTDKATGKDKVIQWITVVGEGLDMPRHLDKLAICKIFLPLPLRIVGAAAAVISLGSLVLDNGKKLPSAKGDNQRWEKITAIITYLGKAILAVTGLALGAQWIGATKVVLLGLSIVGEAADTAGLAHAILKQYPKQVKEEQEALRKVKEAFSKAA